MWPSKILWLQCCLWEMSLLISIWLATYMDMNDVYKIPICAVTSIGNFVRTTIFHFIKNTFWIYNINISLWGHGPFLSFSYFDIVIYFPVQILKNHLSSIKNFYSEFVFLNSFHFSWFYISIYLYIIILDAIYVFHIYNRIHKHTCTHTLCIYLHIVGYVSAVCVYTLCILQNMGRTYK